ncbi:MAG: HIT family protein [Bacilli bacterium]
MDCIFCKIVKNEINNYKVYEDNICLAFLDIYTDAPGHVLIIPKKHIVDIFSITNEELIHISKISKIIAEKIKNNLKPDGIITYQNNGCAQDVMHYH